MNEPLSNTRLLTMTVDEINDGLRSYRPDLRYTRDDALRFVQLWNHHKLSTRATTVTADGITQVIIVAV